MSPTPRRTWSSVLALASAGVLVGHVLGYGAAELLGAASGVGHGHLDLLLDVAVPLATAALALAALADPRRDGGTSAVSYRRLVAVQTALYLALEFAEHLGAGHGLSTLATAPVVAGLLAQFVVAIAIHAVVRGARGLVHRITEGLRAVTRTPVVLAPAVRSAVLHGRTDAHLLGARAPPRSR